MSAIGGNAPTPSAPNMPLPAAHALRKTGQDRALARRKRGISTADWASWLFIRRDTLWWREPGDPTVSLGTLATTALVLQLHDRLASLAASASDDRALSRDEHRVPQRIRRVRI